MSNEKSGQSKPTVLDWMMIIGIMALVAGWLFYPLIAKADSRSHHLYHQFYENWKTKEGHSCCNHMDCRPASVRQKGEKVEAFIEGEWVTAPPDTVRPYITPDMQSHVCHQGKRIICVSVGGGI